MSVLRKLLPRHPRDDDAWKNLSEIFRICHEQLMGFIAPKLHLRMAAIAVRWMRGEQLPNIIEEYRRRNPKEKLPAAIRNTLKDIEEEIRFKYFRLSLCYLAVLEHVLLQMGQAEYARKLPPLPGFLEVGASDPTMISFVGLGISRFVASFLYRSDAEQAHGRADRACVAEGTGSRRDVGQWPHASRRAARPGERTDILSLLRAVGSIRPRGGDALLVGEPSPRTVHPHRPEALRAVVRALHLEVIDAGT